MNTVNSLLRAAGKFNEQSICQIFEEISERQEIDPEQLIGQLTALSNLPVGNPGNNAKEKELVTFFHFRSHCLFKSFGIEGIRQHGIKWTRKVQRYKRWPLPRFLEPASLCRHWLSGDELNREFIFLQSGGMLARSTLSRG